MENSEELKPCPFCGGEAEIVEDRLYGEDYYAGRCRSCAATSIFEFTKEEAMTEWNRRVCVSSKPETLDTNSVAVKKLDTSTPCVSQNTETLDTNGSCTEKANISTCKESLQRIPRWRVCGDVQKLVLNLSQKAKWEFIINTKTLNVMSYIADDNIAISSEEIGTFDTLKDAKTKVNEYIGWLGECMMYFAENIKTERSGK